MKRSHYLNWRVAFLCATTAIAIVAMAGDIMVIAQSAVKEHERVDWNSRQMLSAIVALSVEGHPLKPGSAGGFVVDSRGLLLTNAHVIDGATAVTATLSSGQEVPGRVVRTDSSADLALVRLSSFDQTLMPLLMGDSDTVRTGHRVLLVGASQEGGTIREGTITGLFPLQHDVQLIQTDISVRIHDAGSALVDAQGYVIGVVSLVLADDLSTASAVSINKAQELVMSESDGPLQ